jgi:aminoglycoside 6'-N-acetyltransferase
MLVGWHADPEVARFWDGKTYTLEEMRARLARQDVDAFIVEAEGRPVGYLQAWRGDQGGGGLDMFLIPSARERGYGPDAARGLALKLAAEGWKPITVDPYLSNERAIAAWRKAGFAPVGERPLDREHPEPWLLMEWRG